MTPKSGEDMLRVRDVRKRFGGVEALAGVSFDVPRGGITGLIGPNGAGKSTLFNAVSGVVPADSGRISLAGEDTTFRKPHEITLKGMVRTFQLSRELGRLTVLENLMLAAPQQRGERLTNIFFRPSVVRAEESKVFDRAMEILELTGMLSVMDNYAEAISGGQKKLLELGRALMLDPVLILLDEPAAGVSPTLMERLCELILDLNRKQEKTFLIIEHDMGLVARLCRKVIVMAAGQHLAEGSFEEISSNRRVVEAYLGGVA